jgi:hypothetical protein
MHYINFYSIYYNIIELQFEFFHINKNILKIRKQITHFIQN